MPELSRLQIFSKNLVLDWKARASLEMYKLIPLSFNGEDTGLLSLQLGFESLRGCHYINN